MIKSHSMGVGDLLRSSAAWRALKRKWPEVELHLLFLSKHEGYPTEGLIREHHLLSSAEFLVIQKGHPGLPKSDRPKVPFLQLVEKVRASARRCRADWVIDFEASGARTSLLTFFAAHACAARSLGINQVFGRSLFYTESAPSVHAFANRFGHRLPLEYTLRDFVVLAQWGIQRAGIPIELELTKAGQLVKETLRRELDQYPLSQPCQSQPRQSQQPQSLSPAATASGHLDLDLDLETDYTIGLNIGCGTADAVYKRPDLNRLAACMQALGERLSHRLVLTGAPNERSINQDFIKAYAARLGVEVTHPSCAHILDFAGRTDLSGLTGVIDACNLFISTDSGPYHMAVALRRPTLVWFTYAEHTSFHDEAWCERLIDPTVEEFVAGALKLKDQNN